MTPRQVFLVRDTFARVDAAPQATSFYDRLFHLAPQVRPLFPADLAAQYGKLAATLAAAVAALDRVGDILPVLRDLGRRHAGYGVEPGHYATVGEALLWSLDHALGDALTDEAREAWAAAYDLLSSEMMAAAA